MKSFGIFAAIAACVSNAAPNAKNIGGDGTGRGKAQTYQMAGGKVDKMSLRLNLYDKDVGDMGWEFHGDVALSVVDATDKKWKEMGWCFRPINESDSSTRFDCLHILFYYDHNNIDAIDTPGYSESFEGMDIFAPRLDSSLITPKDMASFFLDKNIDPGAADKSGEWTINTAKSYKLCTSRGNCTFNAHFFHNFWTNDTENDYRIGQGTNVLYEAYGYAASYTNYPTSKETSSYVVGDVQNIYIERLTWQEKVVRQTSGSTSKLKGLTALGGLVAFVLYY